MCVCVRGCMVQKGEKRRENEKRRGRRYVCVTPIEARSLVKITDHTRNRTLGHMRSNNGLCLQHAQYVLLFLVLAVNSNQFKILRSDTLLL